MEKILNTEFFSYTDWYKVRCISTSNLEIDEDTKVDFIEGQDYMFCVKTINSEPTLGWYLVHNNGHTKVFNETSFTEVFDLRSAKIFRIKDKIDNVTEENNM